jgi:bifunctional DNase/RNase
MVEVVVTRLGRDLSSNAYVVFLREKQGTRFLPIWIGEPEAHAIRVELQHLSRERPLTHDLAKALILSLDAQLQRVTISRVQQRTYYAELHLLSQHKLVQLDARPSDSIAIALRLNAPIFVHESLLMRADEADGEETETLATAADASVSELSPEELKAYLTELKPEDFGKFRP